MFSVYITQFDYILEVILDPRLRGDDNMLYSLPVLRVLVIDTDDVTFVDEEGNSDGCTVLEGDDLVATGCGVTFDVGWCLGHAEFGRDRHLEAHRLLIEEELFNDSVSLEESALRADLFFGDLETFGRVRGFREPPFTAVGVEIFDLT